MSVCNMARKANSQIPPSFTEIKHFDSEAEIDKGIEKLSRCKALLDELWDCKAAYDDPRRHELEDRIRRTALDIFGPNSPEFGRLRYHRIWHGDEFINMTDADIQAGFREGFSHTGVMLKALMDRLRKRDQISIETQQPASGRHLKISICIRA